MPLTTPPSGELRRIRSAFDAATSCKHNASAYACGYRACKPGGPLDAVTRSGKTVKEVIGEFVADGRINEIALAEHIRGALRWRKIASVAKVAGVVGLTVAVVGGALVLRLIRRSEKPTGGAE